MSRSPHIPLLKRDFDLAFLLFSSAVVSEDQKTYAYIGGFYAGTVIPSYLDSHGSAELLILKPALVMKKQVKVKPNAKQQRITEEADGSLTVQLKSPPVDGKANAELVELLAKHYGVARSSITIRSGKTGRSKLLEIDADIEG